MSKLGAWTGRHFVTLILVFTAGGFVFILAELLLERHYRGVQLIAPVSAGVGFALALFALTRRGTLPVALLFLALSATGLYGTLEHFEERTEGGPPAQAAFTASPAAQLVSDVGTPAGSAGRVCWTVGRRLRPTLACTPERERVRAPRRGGDARARQAGG